MLGGGPVVCEELHNLGLIDSSVVVVLFPLLLFLSINVHTNNNKNSRNELARPVMGTIFLVCNWASEASPTSGCSIEISCDICCRYVSYVKLTA